MQGFVLFSAQAPVGTCDLGEDVVSLDVVSLGGPDKRLGILVVQSDVCLESLPNKIVRSRLDFWLHIAADNVTAAASMDTLFSAAAARLADQPKLGPPGKIAGTRELIAHENYRLVYEIQGQTV